MRKINLENYKITVLTNEGPQEQDFRVKDSIMNLLFHPELKLSGLQLLEQNEFAGKILHCDEPTILIEEAEYDKLKAAVNAHTGYSQNDVEFVRRILEVPKVEVEAKDNE